MYWSICTGGVNMYWCCEYVLVEYVLWQYGGKIVAHLFQRNEIHGSPLNVSGFSLFILLYKLYILIKNHIQPAQQVNYRIQYGRFQTWYQIIQQAIRSDLLLYLIKCHKIFGTEQGCSYENGCSSTVLPYLSYGVQGVRSTKTFVP